MHNRWYVNASLSVLAITFSYFKNSSVLKHPKLQPDWSSWKVHKPNVALAPKGLPIPRVDLTFLDVCFRKKRFICVWMKSEWEKLLTLLFATGLHLFAANTSLPLFQNRPQPKGPVSLLKMIQLLIIWLCCMVASSNAARFYCAWHIQVVTRTECRPYPGRI